MTEEQRKERLRIRREKDRAKRTRKMSSVTEDNENQRQAATLKRMKRDDENELERTSLYLCTASLYL